MLVTTIDETKRLPTRIITFPMSAVSRGLQAGMRLQQNIAEMAIKGDEFFAPWCDKAEEQPEWARFDEDETLITIPDVTTTSPVTPAPPRQPAQKSPAQKAATDTAASDTAATAKAPAKKAPARKAAARKAAARKPVATPTPAEPAASTDAEAPAANAGRFALYSSPPAELTEQTAADDAKGPSKKVKQPEIAEYIEYDSLTLAQLRAKLRGLSTEELQELADYERAGRNRAPFATMIDNRIASHQKKSGV